MNISELYLAGTSGIITGTDSNSAIRSGGSGTGGLSSPSEFHQILNQEKTKQLNLSQHAQTRIRSREIPWNTALEKRIGRGIDRAQSKGSREALILADNVAVIADIRSRTIVTLMDRTQMKERIFTNIDSAVLV